MKKPLGIFTISRNESFFLPLWLRHYGKLGGDLFVLDHETEPLDMKYMVRDFDFTRVEVHNPNTDDVMWMKLMIESYLGLQLLQYETIVFAEVDEFLTLDSTMLDLRLPLARAMGYDVISNDRWIRSPMYDKTLVVKTPVVWTAGFHTVENPTNGVMVQNLHLLHFHYFNREIAWNRLKDRMNGKEPKEGAMGFQNKFQERNDFDAHFTAETTRPSEMIPEHIQSVVNEIING